MRDQGLGIELALGNKLQRFLAVAAVHAAGLEGQIVARFEPTDMKQLKDKIEACL